MKNQKRQPGRPKGSESSVHQLNLIKTKTWVWTCNYYLGGTYSSPLTYGQLAQKANEYVSSPRKPSYKYVPASFSRWSRGIHFADLEATVKDLWLFPQGAYTVGPWVEEIDYIDFIDNQGGGFVPLWSAIAGQKDEILESWRNIPSSAWKAWAPFRNKDRTALDSDYIPEKFDNLIQLYQFANHLARAKKQIPQLLALTASIVVSRLSDEKQIILFDDSLFSYEHPQANKYLLRNMRKGINYYLSKIHITIDELASVARYNNYFIYNGDLLSYEEYLNLKNLSRIHSLDQPEEGSVFLFPD